VSRRQNVDFEYAVWVALTVVYQPTAVTVRDVIFVLRRVSSLYGIVHLKPLLQPLSLSLTSSDPLLIQSNVQLGTSLYGELVPRLYVSGKSPLLISTGFDDLKRGR